MVTRTEKLSRLMKMSWDIQRRKRKDRSKALQAAWAIINNEDVTVFYLVKKLNHDKPVSYKVLNQMAPFNH